MTEVFTNSMAANILRYISVPNQYTVHLKLIQLHLNKAGRVKNKRIGSPTAMPALVRTHNFSPYHWCPCFVSFPTSLVMPFALSYVQHPCILSFLLLFKSALSHGSKDAKAD